MTREPHDTEAPVAPAPLRALVVDDEPLARDELIFLLEQCGDVEVVEQAEDAPDALRKLSATRADVAFVDLRMPGPDGIALTEAIKAQRPEVAVVIVSAHDDAALRAFDARALDYLLKPVRLERLRATLSRLRETVYAAPKLAPGGPTEREPLTRLAVRRRGAYVIVDVSDIVFFETRDELVWAVTADDRYALDLTLARLEEQLDPESYFRSHRGALVRLDRIESIEPKGQGLYELVMEHPDAPRVALARDRAKHLRERIPFAG
ncbi:MAG: LytTR family DNA-binding domain-containing protein [Polyangiales bacterium]|nr:response regulator transcription factor [Myxococcales bacterium]MCB9657752.1 response regulator transcription factor [Sandaracinaceae bacterium]